MKIHRFIPSARIAMLSVLVPVLVFIFSQTAFAQKIDCRLHTVKSDETLIDIAGGDEKLAYLIQLLNQIDNPYELNKDSKLVIPDVSLYAEIDGLTPDKLEEKVEELREMIPEAIMKESVASFADKKENKGASSEEEVLAKPVPAPMAMFAGAVPAVMPMFGLFNGATARDANNVLNEFRNSFGGSGGASSMPVAKRYPAPLTGGAVSTTAATAAAKKVSGTGNSVKAAASKIAARKKTTTASAPKKSTTSSSGLNPISAKASGSAFAGASASASVGASLGAGVGASIGSEIGNVIEAAKKAVAGAASAAASSGGKIAGAIAGAAVGSVAGPVGAIAGAAVGASVGASVGSTIGSIANKAVSALKSLF